MPLNDACEVCQSTPAILYYAGRKWRCEGCWRAWKRELKKLQKAVKA